MDKFFNIPFGQAGDRAPISNAALPDGDMSYQQGFGPDFALPKTNPATRNVPREKSNQLYYDVTKAVGELQGQGLPDFITPTLNSGAPFPYALNAIIRDPATGQPLISLASANTALSTDRTKWAFMDLRERVLVTRRGVSQSNTPAVNQAFLQAMADSMTAGGVMVFPDGDWPIDTFTITNDRVSVDAEGDATLILQGNNDGIVVGVAASVLSFCNVTRLKFDRAAKSTSGAAVKFVNTAYSRCAGNEFRNSYRGVWVKTHNDSLLVMLNHFYDGTYDGVYEFNANETWANDLRICQNYFWHVEHAGIYMSADGVGVASVGDTYIHDNVFVSSSSKGALQSQHAIRIEGAGTYNTNIRVYNNQIEGMRQQSIYMTGLNRSPVYGNYVNGTDTNDVGIYYGGGVGNTQIALNTVIGFNGPGVYIYDTSGMLIVLNNFTANVTLGTANGEISLLNLRNSTISNNHFYCASSKWGIDATQASGTYDNVIYANNRFEKFSGNTNFEWDIRHNNFGGNRVLSGNMGNDSTSGVGLAPPTAAQGLQWYPGERIVNKTASELGAAGAKYTILGWVNVAQGAPGTWVQQRCLTGN